MNKQIFPIALLTVAAIGSTFSSTATADPFLPDFASAMFDNSLNIDNPYFPLMPGQRYHFSSEPAPGEDGDSERILVEVLPDTKTILGVETRVVRDRVWLIHPMFGELLIEDTFDWYAQDNAGNVWYMGEYVTDHLYDPSGVETGTIHAGSWEAGVAGALPGYIMEANPPTVGHNYRQEYYLGEAEDQAEVLALDAIVDIPFGMFTAAQIEETSDLDPDALEHKFFAPGIGKVLGYGLDPDTEDIIAITTLVAITPEPTTAMLALFAAICLPSFLATARRGSKGR